MSSFHYVYIDSQYKKTGQTDDNFTFELDNAGYNYFHIEKIVLPHTFYPFRTGVNTKLQFMNTHAQTFTVYIDEGIYDITDIRNEIKTKLNSVQTSSGVTFDTEFNNKTKKLTITANENFMMMFDSVSPYRELGYSFGNLTTLSNKLVATSVVNLTNGDYVNVYSNNLLQHETKITTSGNEYRLLSKVNLDQSWGSTIYYSPALNSLYHLNPSYLGTIDIKLLDQYNRPINFNGRSIVMKIKLYRNNDVLNF